ncbi:MAG: 4Fe-4S dicluster domain-containing protein, partial [Eggerthellaceae bacterium]|nr:4Fe-4S dicluster domain-containing protein [Eggerthellaceae bacterium]
SFEGVRRLILEGDAPVSFACGRTEEHGDVRCTCLATVPWDLAAAAALSNGVVLKADACKDCPHETLVERVKGLVRALKHFLGKERFSTCVFMHDQPDNMRASGTDKRLAFSRIAEGVAQGAETALSGQPTPNMSCYRALLLDVLAGAQQQGEPIDVTWQTLTEDGSCRACEICTKMCPHHALELQIPGYTDNGAVDASGEETPSSEEDKEVGPNQWLIHDATKCTQCGLCYVSCPNENIGGWDNLASSHVPALRAWPIDVELCEKCGRPFKPKDGEVRCIACTRPMFSPSAMR